jgi:hypothetical protein
LAEPLRLAQDVYFGDLPPTDRERHDRERLSFEHADQPSGAVDKHWEPDQSGALVISNLEIAFHIEGLIALFADLKQSGLTAGDILQMLNTAPSKHLGVAKSTGTIERDKDADLMLMDADPFREP